MPLYIGLVAVNLRQRDYERFHHISNVSQH